MKTYKNCYNCYSCDSIRSVTAIKKKKYKNGNVLVTLKCSKCKETLVAVVNTKQDIYETNFPAWYVDIATKKEKETILAKLLRQLKSYF